MSVNQKRKNNHQKKPQGAPQNPSKAPKDGKVFKDERFKAVHFDPKFTPLAKKQQKVKVDSRFKKLFEDPRFRKVSDLDKYGREIEDPQTNKELEEMYYVDEDEQDSQEQSEQEPKKQAKNDKSKVSKMKEKQLEKELQKAKNNQKMNKKGGNFSKKSAAPANCFDEDGNFHWDAESSETSSMLDIDPADFEDDFEFGDGLEDDEVDDFGANDYGDESEQKTKKQVGPVIPYKRLALLDYDWEQLNAADVMLMMHSFLPKSGFINKVTVYPSDFGLQRMKQEEIQGPSGIWFKEFDQDEQDEINAKEAVKKKKKASQQKENKKERKMGGQDAWVYDENTTTDIDPVKLRKYERDRLKYYYAVIDCDSVATAKHLFDNCNDLEFELTSLSIVLQYVPDDLVFPHEPKEVCTELPQKGKVHNFLNRAIQHTNVKLTWEEPKNDRFSIFKNKNLTEKDLEKIDVSNYLASDDSSLDSDEEEELIEKRRQLLLGSGENGGDDEDWRNDFDKKKKKKNYDTEMVIKFTPGFSESGNKILEKEETKKTKKKNVKPSKDDDFFVDAADEQEEEEEEKKETKQEKRAREKKYKEELGLLVDEDVEKKGFKPNLEDERIKTFFERSDFAIDPASKYYNPKTHSNMLLQQVKKRKKVKIQ